MTSANVLNQWVRKFLEKNKVLNNLSAADAAGRIFVFLQSDNGADDRRYLETRGVKIERAVILDAVEDVHAAKGEAVEAARAAKGIDRYRVAPYRFVALNQIIAFPEQEVNQAWEGGRLHNVPLPCGLSGSIGISVTFDSPMLIGTPSGREDRPLVVAEKHVIPGATLRGLIRSTLEIAAHARLSQTNLHRRYGIRDFQHELFRDEGRAAIQAGWLRPWQEGDPPGPGGERTRYVIEPCEYWLARIRDFTPDEQDEGQWHLSWLQRELPARYAHFGMRQVEQFDFDTVHYFSHAPGGAAAQRRVVPNPDGSIEGVWVFSNASPTTKELTVATLDAQDQGKPTQGHHKKTEAVFASTPKGDPVPVSGSVWQTFVENNSTPARREPKPAGNWALLEPTLRAGRRIPVFWIADESGAVADFGLVRVFKRAHRFTVGEVLARTGNGAHLVDPDDIHPDFVEMLFGFVHEPEQRGPSETAMHLKRHLKGRVAFGFAWLSEETPAAVSEVVSTIQSAPRPSYAPFYLASAENKDWSWPDAKLAGRKRYPARAADAQAVRDWLGRYGANKGNRDVESRLRFLEPRDPDRPLRFDGEIRVHNVTPAELGGLLWALTFGGDENKRHLIGRAKTAGAGQALVRITRLDLVPNEGGDAPGMPALHAAFLEHMQSVVAGWPNVAPVRELLRSADPQYGGALGERLSYLDLKDHAELRGKAYGRDGPRAANKALPRLLGFD